jgi:hypothetical protein
MGMINQAFTDVFFKRFDVPYLWGKDDWASFFPIGPQVLAPAPTSHSFFCLHLHCLLESKHVFFSPAETARTTLNAWPDDPKHRHEHTSLMHQVAGIAVKGKSKKNPGVYAEVQFKFCAPGQSPLMADPTGDTDKQREWQESGEASKALSSQRKNIKCQ